MPSPSPAPCGLVLDRIGFRPAAPFIQPRRGGLDRGQRVPPPTPGPVGDPDNHPGGHRHTDKPRPQPPLPSAPGFQHRSFDARTRRPGQPAQPKPAPPHRLYATTTSPAAIRASSDNCGTVPAEDEANPPTRRSIEHGNDYIWLKPKHRSGGTRSPPAASRDSTRAGSTSTVTTGASVHHTAAPAGRPRHERVRNGIP